MTDHTPDDIRALAVRFGIADAAALHDALADATEGTADAHVEQVGLAYQSAVELSQRARLTKLLAALQAELTAPENMSALTLGAEAELFRRELKSYADWLATMPATPQPKRRGKPADAQSQAFVVEMARQWPLLTGEEPKAWRDSITGEPGGRFYEFLTALWPDRWPDSMLPWVDFPSVSAVRRWLADIS